MTKDNERFDKLLKAMASGEPPKRKPLADERETPNPLPEAEKNKPRPDSGPTGANP
jgi:hypothetical protein